MVYRTLQDLRTELQARLGFGAAGAGLGVSQVIFNSFLRQAQSELYWQAAWAELRGREDITIGVGQTLVDYPTAANPQRIEDIYVQVNGTWIPVAEGIDKNLYTTVDSRNYPNFYERLSQLEFWPEADQIYTIRVWYYKPLDPFDDDADRATINDDIVFARALGIAKKHYRHPDADDAIASANSMLDGAKGGAWRQKVFKPERRPYDLPLAKPRVV
jgi:hypothetical protein